MGHPVIPNVKDFKLPFYLSFNVTVVYFIIYCMLGGSKAKVDLASTNISFGITFAAFSVTALSLVALIQSKERFELAKKVGIYENIVLNYRNSIMLSLLMLLIGLFGQLLLSTIDGKLLMIYNLMSIAGIVFISTYVAINVLALVKLLLMP